MTKKYQKTRKLRIGRMVLLMLFLVATCAQSFVNVLKVSAREGAIANYADLGPEHSAITKCYDVEFIFVHGADTDVVTSQDVGAWYEAVESLELKQTGLTYDYYFVGESNYGANYIGADIGVDSLGAFGTTVQTFFSGGTAGEFQESARNGVTEMINRAIEVRNACPETKFVLAGYSEGAYILNQAMSDILSYIGAENIIYIATFGDPKLYLPEGEGILPAACRGMNLSSYRIYAPNCRAHSGVLGAENPYVPAELKGKMGLWCTEKDVMCSNYFDFSDPVGDHVAYASKGIYTEAMRFIYQKLYAEFPEKLRTPTEVIQSQATRDIAIMIDSTASMGGLLEKFKEKALEIAKRTISDGGRVALYEYRDLAADGREYVPKQLCDFDSCTHEEFQRLINGIKLSGGGDVPESTLSASLGVMNGLTWKKGATKSLVILTDAKYHTTEIDGTDIGTVLRRSLEIDPVNFYVVTTAANKAAYRELTSKSGGRVFDVETEVELMEETVLARPDLNFIGLADGYTGVTGFTGFTGAQASFAVRTSASDVDHYEWDLDFSGSFETSTNEPFVNHTYFEAAAGFLQAKVVTTSGLSSTAAMPVTILESTDMTELGEAPVISDVPVKVSGEDASSAEVSFKTDGYATMINLDGMFLGLTTAQGFTLTDLAAGTHTLSLAPVKENGLRGEAVTTEFVVTVSEGKESETGGNVKNTSTGSDGEVKGVETVKNVNDSASGVKALTEKILEGVAAAKENGAAAVKKASAAGVLKPRPEPEFVPLVPDTGRVKE